MNSVQFPPGSLIKARGREWMVINSLNNEVIKVRPLTGSEDDQTLIYPALESEPVTQAIFPDPQAFQLGSNEPASLLRDALMLSLRRGAGPFRCFGQISVEPRAYQLVPLLMALKLNVVRLLIADDVGIGKTIEAALILRELLDRGEINRFAVLCPPHLVDQWVNELEIRFHLKAVPVTASSAARLEKNLPVGESLFTVYPFTVVSLDYIKAESRRSEFLRVCPEFVVVDEAHTCTIGDKGRHQRYELLKELSTDAERHLLLLTATPHSGNEDAFYKTLGLLDTEFEKLKEVTDKDREKLREKLSNHFVQRRRPDIAEWKDGSFFPKRETLESTYELTGDWKSFLDQILDYCAEVVDSSGTDERKRRLNFWGTLALLRCVSSSPAAAIQALKTRSVSSNLSKEFVEDFEGQVFDEESDSLINNDQEPSTGFSDKKISKFIEDAKKLSGNSGDPKFHTLKKHVDDLIKDGFSPVIFCRYIATAHYLKSLLINSYKGVSVDSVTGELTSSERKLKVDELRLADQRILVATDCLSEGINLQDSFDAVIHYDLSWNPTRHEQREGRVDRYGQPNPVVRTILLYGANNPVDGAVLKVILRKAESIRRELGVPVPLPDENHKLVEALMTAVLIRRDDKQHQLTMFDALSLGDSFQMDLLPQETRKEVQEIGLLWKDAAEKAKKNRTIFSQSRLKPDEVLPEWHRSLGSIGDSDDVKRFTIRALSRLGAEPEKLKNGYKLPLSSLPDYIRERLLQENLSGNLLIDFSKSPSGKFISITRSHPLVHVLAESLLERSLSRFEKGNDVFDPSVLGRVGCWISAEVTKKTTIAILRIRHHLNSQSKSKSNSLLVEEASCVSWVGKNVSELMHGQEILNLISAAPSKSMPDILINRNIKEALETLSEIRPSLNDFAEKRAKELLADHRRVREASEARGKYSVKAMLPIDVVGLYVLLPSVD